MVPNCSVLTSNKQSDCKNIIKQVKTKETKLIQKFKQNLSTKYSRLGLHFKKNTKLQTKNIESIQKV